MTKVKNIKTGELATETKDANFQKCIEYIKMIDPDYKKYLPQKPKRQLSFDLTETSSELANCIRRFLIEEIPVLSMNVEEDDVKTDDEFILPDFLKKNIELIPFEQELGNDSDKIVISLDVSNKTDKIKTIYSGDLKVKVGASEKSAEKYFSTRIPIIKLRPTKSLSIKNITITEGVGRQDSGKFILLSNIRYKIMDVEPVEETKYNRTGESSLNSAPHHFQIGFTTHRNISPKLVMKKCCDKIIERMENIQHSLKDIKSDDKVHFSDLIDLESKGDVKIFHFKGEYWTLANLMAKYCYLTDKNVQFVTAGIIHPSNEESLVKLRHSDPVKLLGAAIKSILGDVSTIQKSFK